MAMRRDDLLEIGGFQSTHLEDLDGSLRLAHRWPDRRILYEPAAKVNHLVPANRMTWSYFWRRCFTENRSKAEVLRRAGCASSLAAERRHALHTIPSAVWDNVKDVFRGDASGFARIGASAVGIGMAAIGLIVGSAEQRLRWGTVPNGVQVGSVPFARLDGVVVTRHRGRPTPHG